MARSVLDRAAALAARGKFGEAVALLEPQLPIYRESHRFYFILGSACLRCNDSGGAWTYLKRAEQLEPSHRDTLLLIAALHLRRAETQKAIEYYLRVLEEHPGEQLAARSLAFLRRKDAEESIAHLVDTGAFDRFYPRSRGLPRLVVPLGSAILVAAILYFGFPLAKEILSGIMVANSPRPEVAAISLSDAERLSPVETGGSYRFILTEKEALADFEKAKADFENYRDNAALVLLNRLLLSNASGSIKEKARILKGFVRKPDFRTVKDIPDYAVVAKSPELYEGCSVVWKGRAANIVEERGMTSFHFLVGYVDKTRLEGILPVRITGQKTLVPKDAPFELLAIVALDKGNLALDGSAIHELRDGR